MPAAERKLSWRRLRRPLVAALVGGAAWAIVAASQLTQPRTPAESRVLVAALTIDALLGMAALAVVPLRRRYPLATACALTLVSAFSVAGVGPMALSVASMATRRRRDWIAVTAAVSLAAGLISKLVYHPLVYVTDITATGVIGGLLLGLMFFAATMATGSYLGARRDLVTSLRERVLTAEREQALQTQLARDAERTRIAREMHDALAHRISLVALHAGALAYRDDLTREQMADVAQTVQTNARLALVELRQVLGVLRDGAEPPQPTLDELPALLADAREAGSVVELDNAGVPVRAGLPESLSRTSFRIVQETLTNARRHAPGEPVHIRLVGSPGRNLEIEVRNRVRPRPAEALPSAGLGLAGLGERAELAGGTFEHRADDGYFVVRARLPWPA